MTKSWMKRSGVLLLGLSLWLLGCASTLRELSSADALESYATDATQEYKIGPGDVLQITVWKQPELSVRELVVRLDGKISFPLVDDVHAEGLSAQMLKAVLAERLSKYITAPHVTVVVREINSKLVYVIGEVAREGPIVFRSKMRIVDALAIAGGFRQFASRDSIKLIREYNGSGPVEFIFDYDAFVAGKNLAQNVLLLPGDRIVVPPERLFSW